LNEGRRMTLAFCFLGDQFRGSDADMFGGDELAFFRSGGDKGPSGQVIGPAEEPAGALVDGGDGLFGKKRLFDSGDLQVMVEVALHILAIHPFEMGPF